MAEWYSVASSEQTERLLGAWADAPIEDEETCAFLLETARDQVLDYAPNLAEGAAIPNRWVFAQLKQAENLWNAGRVSGGGEAGIDGQYNFKPRPLDKTIKNIIRPQKGGPRVR